MTYKQDKKKLKKFFQNEKVNPEVIFDKLLEGMDDRKSYIIYHRWGFYDKPGTPGYQEIYERTWKSVVKEFSEDFGFEYTPSWTSELFELGLRGLRHPSKKKRIDYMEKELRNFVKKENINDKSVYLYFHKYFLFYDELLRKVRLKSLRDYYLFR